MPLPVVDPNFWYEQIFHLSPAYSDSRGEITNVIQNVAFHHIAVITSLKGSVRGNHVHPEPQWMYLISGSYESYCQDPNKDGYAPPTLVCQRVVPGDLVYCPPNTIHAYRFLEDSVFLNLTQDDRDPSRFDEHTVRKVILHPKG